MEDKVLSVSQLNEYIRVQMDRDASLASVAIRGEISNYKLYPSGHHYFTIKDDASALKCVMFKGNAFRLRFRPENGMKIIAFGKISVYPRDGVYQLYCTNMNIDGIGDLYVAFEQLKTKLQGQGLFAESHKKPLPKHPNVIGIITSEAGAAVHDMIRVLRHRYPLAKVKLIPVRVQGIEAPGEIAAAIAYANLYKLADVLIVGRGGGSIEDLWAFNEEIVAHSIYNSQIPVISAVGHEPDVTISDYVADVRAATPSNAAELAVPDQDSLRQILDALEDNMTSIMQGYIQLSKARLRVLSASSALRSRDAYIDNKQKALALLSNRMLSAYSNTVHKNRQRFFMQTAKLDAMSPLKVLTRGYSMVKNQKGVLITDVDQVSVGESVKLNVSNGILTAIVTEKEKTRHEQ